MNRSSSRCAALVVAMLTVVPVSAAPAPVIAWERDFKQAMRRAKAEGKPVMVDFWAEWCQWCHELDATTYQDAKVVELANAFVAVKVDTEGTLTQRELSARYGVETLPTIGFVSPSGRLFLRHASFEGPEQFPATLEEARRRAGEVMTWEAALTRNHADPAALAGLGALLIDQNLQADGRDLLRRAVKADGSRPAKERKHTRRALALVEGQGGTRAESQRLLEEALAIQPSDADEDAAARAALGELRAR